MSATYVSETGRLVSRFSCGAASACATKMVLAEYGSRVHIVNAFLASEDPDNRRFLADCEKWFGIPITIVRDEKYGAHAVEVWRKKRFIVHQSGAPCSKALKREVLNAQDQPGDTIVLGYTADKRDAARLDRWIDANPGEHVLAPLIDAGMTKRDCLEMVAAAGIELPRMYRLGYHNANCPGCPKGGEGYWNKFPACRSRVTCGERPRSRLIRPVTGSRWVGLQHNVRRHRWSISRPGGIGPKRSSYVARCERTSCPSRPP